MKLSKACENTIIKKILDRVHARIQRYLPADTMFSKKTRDMFKEFIRSPILTRSNDLILYDMADTCANGRAEQVYADGGFDSSNGIPCFCASE